MGSSILQGIGRSAWELSRRQHGVITRKQLLALGLSAQAIQHRLSTRRLYSVRRGVYAVGRPELSRLGRWMAAVLSCGPDAVLSPSSAAALWGIAPEAPGAIEISVPLRSAPRPKDVQVHRRYSLRAGDVRLHERIPVTTAACTLVDLAARLDSGALSRAIGEADKLGLADIDSLRTAISSCASRPGVGRLKKLLGEETFRLTDSELERRFLVLVRDTGLPLPLTRRRVNGFRVDFFWPDIGLVVETDGLRYHRTPAQQARDRERDQAHTAAGLTPLRFTHAQVCFEARHVEATLRAVVRRIQGRAPEP